NAEILMPERCATNGRLSGGCTQRPERGAQFGSEDIRVFPRCEMSALVGMVEVAEARERAARPGLRRLIDLIRKYRDGNRQLDVCRLPRSRAQRTAASIFPV